MSGRGAVNRYTKGGLVLEGITPDFSQAPYNDPYNDPAMTLYDADGNMLCEVEGGVFKENSETIGFDYFTKDNLPILATEKNNEEQIQMCFDETPK